MNNQLPIINHQTGKFYRFTFGHSVIGLKRVQGSKDSRGRVR
jgi:hypothetical protein